MISRRTLLKWSAAASIAVPATGYAQMAHVPEGIDAVLLDRRYAPATLGDAFGRRVYSFAGDVTRVWFDTLDPIWRRPGFVLGGITGQDALFVLERLAWDRGRKVIDRSELPRRGADGQAILSWVIAPVHPSVRA